MTVKVIKKQEVEKAEQNLKRAELGEADARLRVIAIKYPDNFKQLLAKYCKEFKISLC